MTNIESDPSGGISASVTNVKLPYEYVRGIHTEQYSKKLFNPLNDPTATERLLSLRENWARNGQTTVFTSGGYDLEHLDHSGYLLHVKAAGAAIHYDRTESGESWDKLLDSERYDYTTYALGNRSVRLIVSVDGDVSMSARKGNNAAKGGGQRPILGWQTRAMDVARESFINPTDPTQETLLPTVDAVTIHGPDDFIENDTHAMHFDLVKKIQPDGWVIFGESVDILEGVAGREKLAAVALLCIEDGAGIHYYEDPIIGKMSTTSIVKRIKG